MGYFGDGANYKVEGHITVTSTGLLLILFTADTFVSFLNRLCFQIFLVICIRISSALDIGYFSKAGLPVRVKKLQNVALVAGFNLLSFLSLNSQKSEFYGHFSGAHLFKNSNV